MRSRSVPPAVDLSPLARRLGTPSPTGWEAMPVADLIERIEAALANFRDTDFPTEPD